MIFSQSRYPLKTVINGDSVVILTTGQADTINIIFESQKAKIAAYKKETIVKDSIIRLRDTLVLFYYQKYTEYNTIIETQFVKDDRLDSLQKWIIDRAMEGAWIYYSYINTEVVAVNLSTYAVRKDDYKGDIIFINGCGEKEDKEPKVDWQTDIALPERPKIKKLKI